jgi:hypothetical protein
VCKTTQGKTRGALTWAVEDLRLDYSKANWHKFINATGVKKKIGGITA